MNCVSDMFKSHEVDIATFQTLSESDLKEIGVSALGARRKMLLCISGKCIYPLTSFIWGWTVTH